jgi:hypothetical protein
LRITLMHVRSPDRVCIKYLRGRHRLGTNVRLGSADCLDALPEVAGFV